MVEYQFPPTRIRNMNDTAISTAHEPGFIVRRKGRKILGGKQMVPLCAASAGSSFVSPDIYLPSTEEEIRPAKWDVIGALNLCGPIGSCLWCGCISCELINCAGMGDCFNYLLACLINFLFTYLLT